jgi:hypothetical protein
MIITALLRPVAPVRTMHHLFFRDVDYAPGLDNTQAVRQLWR